MSNFKRDRFFIKINLREDVWKQNLRILLRFTETPGISNKQTRKLPLLVCFLEMLGVFVNFTKMRNFCLQTSSNRIILKEMRSLLEFEDIGFKMAMYCHPYYEETDQENTSFVDSRSIVHVDGLAATSAKIW